MSEAEVLLRPGLYIGGLRSDLHRGKLAGLLCTLLWRFQVCAHTHTTTTTTTQTINGGESSDIVGYIQTTERRETERH